MIPDASATYAKTRVLVTGAAGFIGSHLVRSLKQNQAEVTACLHTEQSRSREFLDGVDYKVLDVEDQSGVNAAVSSARPQVIFHLAALIGGDRSPAAMHNQAYTSFLGALNVALAATESKASLLVHLGSSEEYGDGPAPFKEDQAEKPLSAYSAAKVAATHFLLASYRNFQLPVIIVRPTVVYGPGQQADMLIPYLFKCYVTGKPAKMTAGEQTRDFVYIDDLIAALLAAGRRPDLAGQIFNVASESEHKVKDMAGKIAQICGYRGGLGLGVLPYRSPEVMRHLASCAKAAELLGWQPQVDLDEGLRRTYSWLQSSTFTHFGA